MILKNTSDVKLDSHKLEGDSDSDSLADEDYTEGQLIVKPQAPSLKKSETSILKPINSQP
jgi:hypothetical protein